MLYDKFIQQHPTAPIDDPDACQTLLWMLVSGMWGKMRFSKLMTDT